MRSRAVRRDLECWLSTALAPPPSQIFSSSLRIWATRSARARMLDSKRRELGSILVGRMLLIERDVESVRSGMRAKSETLASRLLYEFTISAAVERNTYCCKVRWSKA